MPSEMLQQLYLSERTLGQDLLAEDIGNFLDCDTLLTLRIRSRTAMNRDQQTFPRSRTMQSYRRAIPDNTVGSLTKFLGHGISLIDDEVLVEHLKHLSSL